MESYDKNNSLRSWTLIYLSRLLGNDLTQDRYYAIHENGSSYDDDVLARIHAESLFKRISN